MIISIILEWTSKFIVFLTSYIISNRIIAVPIALGLKFPKYIVLPMVVIFDLLQVPLFNFICSLNINGKGLIWKLISWLPSKERVENSRLGKFCQHLGGMGIVLISAVPAFGGGIWSAVLIAQVLHIDNRRSMLLIGIGSILSTLAVMYGTQALYNLYYLILHSI